MRQFSLGEFADINAWFKIDLDQVSDHLLGLFYDSRRCEQPHAICDSNQRLRFAFQLDLITEMRLQKRL